MKGCIWINEEWCYETECGESFVITNGTPHDNGMKFCCYCGGNLIEEVDEVEASNQCL